MSEYKRKLRSGKLLPEINTSPPPPKKKEEEDNKNEPASPKTPPSQSIEAYFPPSPYGKKRHQPYGDRFIPNRDRNLASDFQMLISTTNEANSAEKSTPETLFTIDKSRRFNAYFRAELLDDMTAVNDYRYESSRSCRRVFQYTSTSSSSSSNYTQTTATTNYLEQLNESNSPILSSSPIREPLLDSPTSSRYQTSLIGEAGRRILLASDRYSRYINTTPIKILDAPELLDDFYLNLMDWGINDNVAVGLGSCVYLWNANTSQVTQLCDLVTDTIASVNWAHVGSLLAVGTHSGRSILYDTEHLKRLRVWSNHTSRISSIAWNHNVLTTGGRDHAIYHHDVRSPNPYFRKLNGHRQEICGLKWNSDGTMLASGGNDNKLIIWNSHQNLITHRLAQHTAAVKAISWSPHKRGLLVSGGGTTDKTIKFWDAKSGTLLGSHDTGSQVCNLLWSKKTDEIVSTHGYADNDVFSSNQVVIWKPDKMQRIVTLTGHTSRVLYMSMSHDGNTVVTGAGAGDESIRFWDVFSSVGYNRHDRGNRLSRLR